jgi:hypothetical protein
VRRSPHGRAPGAFRPGFLQSARWRRRPVDV